MKNKRNKIILFLLLTFLKLRKIGKILPNKNIKIKTTHIKILEFNRSNLAKYNKKIEVKVNKK
mgnify:CR=1 FL=1